jgi:hypothetical protein
MKLLKIFAGNRRVAEIEVWDQEYVDMEVPGYIRIGSDGTGRFQFGPVSGDIVGRVWGNPRGATVLRQVDASSRNEIKTSDLKDTPYIIE